MCKLRYCTQQLIDAHYDFYDYIMHWKLFLTTWKRAVDCRLSTDVGSSNNLWRYENSSAHRTWHCDTVILWFYLRITYNYYLFAARWSHYNYLTKIIFNYYSFVLNIYSRYFTCGEIKIGNMQTCKHANCNLCCFYNVCNYRMFRFVRN